MKRWLPKILLIPALFALLMGPMGCEENYEEETALFERAEEHYRYGDYDGAIELYERFLTAHPISPLAEIAQQRLRTIERELDSIMSRRGAPAPIRVNPFGHVDSPPEPEETHIHLDPPDLPSLGE